MARSQLLLLLRLQCHWPGRWGGWVSKVTSCGFSGLYTAVSARPLPGSLTLGEANSPLSPPMQEPKIGSHWFARREKQHGPAHGSRYKCLPVACIFPVTCLLLVTSLTYHCTRQGKAHWKPRHKSSSFSAIKTKKKKKNNKAPISG